MKKVWDVRRDTCHVLDLSPERCGVVRRCEWDAYPLPLHPKKIPEELTMCSPIPEEVVLSSGCALIDRPKSSTREQASNVKK